MSRIRNVCRCVGPLLALTIASASTSAAAVTPTPVGTAVSPVGAPSGFPALVGPIAGEAHRLIYGQVTALGNGQPNEPILHIGGDEQAGADLMEYDGSGLPVDLGVEPISDAGSAEPYSLVGRMLTTAPNYDGTVLWWNLDDHTSGTATVPGYAGSSADGWYYVDGDTIDDESTNGVVTPVATPFAASGEAIVDASVGPQGLVVAGTGGGLAYVTFGGVVTPLHSAWHADAGTRDDEVRCGGTSATQTLCIITGVDDNDDGIDVLTQRVPLDGSAAQAAPGECSGTGIGTPSVAFTADTMICGDELVTSQPLTASPSTSVSSYSVGINAYGAPQVVAAFGTAVAASADQSQLETITDAATPPTQLLSPPKSDVTVGDFALTTGRVAWTTDQPAAGHPSSEALSVRSESVSAAAGSLVTGPSAAIAATHGWVGIAASGTTTAFALKLFTDNPGLEPEPVEVVAARRTTVLRSVPTDSVSVSGNLVLYRVAHAHFTGSGTYMLLNAVTGKVTAVAALNRAHRANSDLSPSALWGDHVSYVSSSGTVHRLNVLTGKAITVAHGSDPNYEGQLFEYGPYVAWRAGGNEGVSHAYVRNMTTMSAPVRLPANDFVSGLSDSGILLSNEDTEVFSLRGYDASDPVTPVFTPTGFEEVPQVSDGVMAWLDPAGVLRAAALPAQTYTPLALGTPYAPARLAAGGRHAWRPSLPFSAALTSCRLVIRRHGTVFQTLTCARPAMAAGVAALRWTGQSATGHQAKPGAYTWRATVRGTSGAATTETGLVTVTR